MRTLEIPFKKADFERLRQTLPTSTKRVEVPQDAAVPFEITRDFSPKAPKVVLSYKGKRAVLLKGHEDGNLIMSVYLPPNKSVDVVIEKSLMSVVNEIKGLDAQKKTEKKEVEVENVNLDGFSKQDLVSWFLDSLPEEEYLWLEEGVHFLPRIPYTIKSDLGNDFVAHCTNTSLSIYFKRNFLFGVRISSCEESSFDVRYDFKANEIREAFRGKLYPLWLRTLEAKCTFNLESLRTENDDKLVSELSAYDDGYSF